MKQVMLIAIITLVPLATVVTASGATDQDPPTASELLSRALAKPRYYSVSASGGSKSQGGQKICIGRETLKMFEDIQQEAKNPQAMAQLSKGCTQKIEHKTPGSVFIEQNCDATAGAMFTSRMTLSGSIDEWRQHTELKLGIPGKEGEGDVSVGDVVMSYLGECPVNVKPGQVLLPDGTVEDAFS